MCINHHGNVLTQLPGVDIIYKNGRFTILWEYMGIVFQLVVSDQVGNDYPIKAALKSLAVY